VKVDVLVEGQEVSYTLGLMYGEVVEADVDLLLGRLLGHQGADETLEATRAGLGHYDAQRRRRLLLR
jgi:hypothetical protein